MKMLSFALLTVALSFSSCAHKKGGCCGGKEAVSCSKHGADQEACKKEGKCAEKKSCCGGESCQKKS